MKFLFSVLISLVALFNNYSFSQSCCSGSSSCPIAGGASQGVLAEKQVEVNTNYQYIFSDKFLNGDTADANFLDLYKSRYNYLRLAYGVTEKLTLSLESGYYFNKTQVGLNKRDTISSSGIGDLILFPRYNVYHHQGSNGNFDATIGLGLKIPIGDYNDSLKQVEPFSGTTYYLRKPPAIQPSSGAQDFIFYAMIFKGFTKAKFRIFSNFIFIKKGWNPLGEKAGNYSSAGLFFSKSVLKNLGVIMEVKGEHTNKLKLNNDLFLMGFYNYDVNATGGNKLFIVPQINYSYKSLSLFANGEFPLYQNLNGTQIASKYLFTVGLSYKFFPFKKKIAIGTYYCPMHPHETSLTTGKCSICGMDYILMK